VAITTETPRLSGIVNLGENRQEKDPSETSVSHGRDPSTSLPTDHCRYYRNKQPYNIRSREFLLRIQVRCAFSKYSNFALDTAKIVSVWLGSEITVGKLDIVLPVGISFYTFHTITYIVDSYRRVITPTRNLFEFSCYVCLFAQLVAGPIVRFRQIEADLENIAQADRSKYLDIGWFFFVIGLSKKVLLADIEIP
jgi:D-alanyl-lipoteichoic acid acyltransferase DltB (MBOAT superfamily)